MSYPPIYFLRHGQTEWNAARRLQGQLDSPLSATGRAHAQSQGLLLAPFLAAGCPLFCSPLGRAVETASIAAPGYPLTYDPRLSEIHAGDWEGLTHTEISSGWPDLYAAAPKGLDLYSAAPGGEGYAALLARIEAFLADLDAPSIVIAHGLWWQVLRGVVCGVDRSDLSTLSNHQGVIYQLEQGREIVLR